tara:strand:- start:310 stop:504 length:195 start_codon:yes stop_codon:yes gene_type:complete
VSRLSVGDIVQDEDEGIGIIKGIYFDDNIEDGIIYYVWWMTTDQLSFEHYQDLFPIVKGGGTKT